MTPPLPLTREQLVHQARFMPKTFWGAASLSTESLRWVRPLSGIVAILGEDLVECVFGAVKSGYAPRGGSRV